MENSLSTIILAKDSASTIEKAIKSVQCISEQIIVIDTGSEDDTAEVCSRKGAEVYFYRWNNSFSNVRNYALKLARADWILMIDSDEELDLSTFEKYSFLLNNDKIGGITVLIKNFLSDDLISEHRYTRIFRANANFYFKGRVHEQISESILEQGYVIENSDIVIYHHGYKEFSQEKYIRNKELLLLDLLENPYDDYIKYHLAETEFAGLNFVEAEKLFSDLLSSPHLSSRQQEFVRLRLAQISIKKDNSDDAEKYLNFVSEDINIEGFRKYLLAIALIMKKDLSTAQILLSDEIVAKSTLVNKNQYLDLLTSLKKLIL